MALSGLVMAATPLLASAPAAHAVLPAGQVAVAFGGSDTTDNMIGQMLPDLDNRSLPITVGTTTTNQTVRVFNIPAFSSTNYTVPGDAECTDVTWSKDPLAPGSNTAATQGISPFGSTAGRNYLAAEDGGTGPNPPSPAPPTPTGTNFGCIDIARSSGAPRATGGGDRSTFEYYAFAHDAVSWASTSLHAPATLTTQNLKDIYINCTITDWGQLPGGLTGPITRYLPQAGSGTRAFFISSFLGNVTPSNAAPCNTVPPLVLGEENNGKIVASADQDKAILPYSGAVWSYQAAQSLNPSLDKRNSSEFGGIQTVTTCSPTPCTPPPAVNKSALYWNSIDVAYELDNTATGVVQDSNVSQANGNLSEANGAFPGIRFVYNVIDAVSNHQGYQAAKQLVGFANSTGGSKGILCDATATGAGSNEFAIMLSNFFTPLKEVVVTGSNAAGSSCRFYQGVT